MTDQPVKANTPKPGDRGYKRSWKNLLINKKYQLRFTLFMVGLAALLMVLLGYRVMSKANEATTVSKVGILGETCTSIPPLATDDMGAGAAGTDVDGAGTTGTDPNGAGSDSAGSAAGSAATTAGSNAATGGSAAAGSGSDSGNGSSTANGSAAAGSGTTNGSAATTAGSGSGSAVAPPSPLIAAVIAQWCTEDNETLCPTEPVAGKPLVVTAAAACDDVVDYKLGADEGLDPLHKAKIAVIECKDGKKHDVPAKSRRAKPKMDESTFEVAFNLPEGYSDAIASHWSCEIAHAGKLAELDRGKLKIFLVLIASGLLLLVGLAVYGIKMTHKVAGPLFKVSLYLGKMRDGRLDKVYNLRKGDQLVDFYDHFKSAHGGVVDMEKADIAQLKSVIAAAETAGAGEHAAVSELRAILARKEKTIE